MVDPFNASWIRYVQPALTLRALHFVQCVYLCVLYDSHNKTAIIFQTVYMTAFCTKDIR
jgi:hypothetical protein